MTARETLNEARVFLRDAGIESYDIDAALLLAKVLNTDRTRLFLDAENDVKQRDYETYQELLERRANRECVACITNSKEFRFLDFYVDKNALVPRPDTETLVEAVLRRIDEVAETKKDISVLDLCTGSGAIAVSLKHERPFIEMHASDISEAALAVAKKNAKRFIPREGVNFILSDVFENIHRRFDMIVANAPYIPSGLIETLQDEARNEPVIALDGGADGLEIIRRVISGAAACLLPEGCVFLEADPGQTGEIARLFESAGFCGVEIIRDLSGANRVTEARLPL
ncbi:MAG: peptide chain release factor N(5)-glutamine methyltransferase [Spirochaetaceae bacterium]|jgi:release factor glutamine methyltransferase|nr:peptide chain release factor N(5)-glutamine methyltransferase [Spirochaetaceae bacterium]